MSTQRQAMSANAAAAILGNTVASRLTNAQDIRVSVLPCPCPDGTRREAMWLNCRTNRLRVAVEITHHRGEATQMKLARSPARHVSQDQLAFVFSEPALLAPAIAPPTRPIRQSNKPAARTVKVARTPTRPVDRDDLRLTVEDAAELLSVSVKTLEAWRRLGKGPAFVKLGRSVRYTMRAIDEFTTARTVRNSAEGRMLDARP